MSRLTWIERDHRWRAGPYEIELAAPQLWVCTRRLADGTVSVEQTSGSLNALKTRVERTENRRQDTRRSLLYVALFLLSMTAVGVGAVTELTAIVIGFAVLGIWSALKAVDCVLRRSWESLHLTYQ